ncbi:MAG: TVP38/TMEM64 family protein, partial [Onishia taeanensis]|uniref:TVP38/TMEM64 family protein n=1 Tax=Onishia taeanensis TaxID=284577 RepID=UPI003C7CE47A
MTPERRQLLISRLLLLALVVLLVVLGVWLYQAGLLQRETVMALAEELGIWGPPALVGLMILTVVVGPIPTMVVSVAAGMVYGPGWGFLISMVGALMGATLSFWIARILGQPVIERFTRSHLALCERCSDRLLFGVVLLARLIPVVSFALVSYGAGLTAMTTRRFLLATALGMSPMTFFYVMAGTGLGFDSRWVIVGGVMAVAVLLGLPRLIESGWIPLPARWREALRVLRDLGH